jgi:hypothetical protein
MFKQSYFCIFYFLIYSACTNIDSKNSESFSSLKLIDKITISNDQAFDETIVGGMSSIDYLDGDRFVMISDDRSEFSPARFYEIEISFDSFGINNYEIDKVVFLKNKEGEFFEENELDPESIRHKSSSNTYFYTSEGGRTKKWLNPFVWEMDRNGNFISEVNVPEKFHFDDDKGLRENGGFESLTFENDTIIWYANELPLKEDGEVPSSEEGKYPVRLVRHDIKNDIVLSQYAYQIGHLSDKPNPEDGFFINSVPEILFVEENSIWVVERSYITGVGNFVLIYAIDYHNASDVKDVNALAEMDYEAVSKKLLLDFSDFNMKIDNIEGFTFGPDFPDGRRSLLFISDDNFNKEQETQLWLFSVEGVN